MATEPWSQADIDEVDRELAAITAGAVVTPDRYAQTDSALLEDPEEAPMDLRAAAARRGVVVPPARQEPDVSPADPDDWPPPPDEAAYHGVAGGIVRAVEAATEADPVGILVTLLATAGALMGDERACYQGALHTPRLYIVLAGETSTGRKGTAGSLAKAVFDAAMPDWTKIIVAGLGSGEGLVGRLKPDKDGVYPDHRALVLESELGRLLTVMTREGSTLSPILRDAWDGVPMGRALAREQAIVERHHVALVGHVTPTELRTKLSDVDAANGFGNRFLWMAVRQTRLVPFPTNPRRSIAPFVTPLRQAIAAARTPGELTWTPAAADRWEALYAELRMRRRPGLAGAILARAEAQVVRLALVYALLDQASAIDLDHLEAAEAVWAYAERSALYLFGRSTGNRHADLVLRRLREVGELDRQTIKAETGLRLGADLDDVERVLVDAGLAVRVEVPRPDGTARRRRVLRLADASKQAKQAKESGARADEMSEITL